MYISELSLHGFKSFAKKEKLKFGKGITVIVGPNGCGKTNIVDAIRWVLGEQKYSVLRSGKMGDVIFNGADGLKPLSVCEAFLTVHNNKGKLPVEYTDVEIGRRVYRNGESEYYINRTPCRLKDIHDLFIDTGMGSDAYSVIELKMIEQILSESDDDRKRMFEEAAGINKYKQQRHLTLRKFDAVQKDLDRVNDIVQEVEQKVRGLNLQLKRFDRHKKLSEELRKNEMGLAYINIQDYKSDLNPLRKGLEEFNRKKDEGKSDTSIQEKELEGLKLAFSSQQKELEEMQSNIRLLQKKREASQGNMIIWKEQTRASKSDKERLNNEILSNGKKKAELEGKVYNYRKNISLIEPRINKQLVNYESKKNEFDKVEDRYFNIQNLLKSAHDKKWDIQQKIIKDISSLETADQIINEKNNLILNLNKKIKFVEKNQLICAKNQIGLESRKINYSKKNNLINNDIKKSQSLKDELFTGKSSLLMEIYSTSSDIESLKSELGFFILFVEQNQGYPQGVKIILTNPKDYPEIIGTVGDIFQIEDKFDLAFQSALGDWTKCLVAKDRKSALSVIKRASQNKIGNLSILPLEELDEPIFKKLVKPKISGILGTGIELSGISSDYISLAHLIIGNLLIIKNLDSLLPLSLDNDWSYVDLKGAYCGNNHLLRHINKTKDTSVLGRKKKIKDLSLAIKTNEIIKNKKEKKLLELEGLLKLKISDLDALKILADESINSLSEIETELIKIHYKQSQNLETIKNLKDDSLKASKELFFHREAAIEIRPKIAKINLEMDKIKIEENMLSKSQALIQKERDNVQQMVQDLRIELLSSENEKDTINFQLKSAKESDLNIDERQGIIKKELMRLDEKVETLSLQLSSEDKVADKVGVDLERDESILNQKKEALDVIYKSMNKIQSDITSERQSRENLLEHQRQSELRIIEIEQKINTNLQRVKDLYDLDVPSELIVEDEPLALQSKINQIQKSLENIGPINMIVKQESDEEQDRLDNLIEQRIDIINSENNLRETIDKIDRVARKKFEETFDQIKLNFSDLFEMFFEGGNASLSLEGNTDPLESSISIHAQPPGKKNQNLRMLSAGEKSLTAIALLFAIYQFKPSPYCILDEVDAPLDDVNIQKFKRVISKFANDTQFIVVTHNKLTMEAADYLYGVTMEKKGVSKLVSVKFNET